MEEELFVRQELLQQEMSELVRVLEIMSIQLVALRKEVARLKGMGIQAVTPRWVQ